jgi:hypothetical protein
MNAEMCVSNPEKSKSKIQNLCPWMAIVNENDVLIYEDFGQSPKTHIFTTRKNHLLSSRFKQQLVLKFVIYLSFSDKHSPVIDAVFKIL